MKKEHEKVLKEEIEKTIKQTKEEAKKDMEYLFAMKQKRRRELSISSLTG